MAEFSDQGLLDDISQQVLLLFLKEQGLTLHKIAEKIDETMNAANYAITILEKRKYIKRGTDNNFQLTAEGKEYLKITSKIMRATPKESKDQKKAPEKAKPRPFVSIGDFMLWALAPVLILSVGLTGIVMFLSNRITLIIIAVSLAVILLIYFLWTFRRVFEYERLVVYRWGRSIGAKGPGPVLIIPLFDDVAPVDIRQEHKEIPKEACITKDNVQISVDFVYYWQIQDPEKSVTRVINAPESIRLLATGALRAVIARYNFSEVQEKRQELNITLKKEIDDICFDWGIYVTNVDIQAVTTSEEIRKAMEKRRAAEWESEATAIQAEGDAKALNSLRQAAYRLDNNTLNLKYFEMLEKLGQGQATKYIFPMELTNLVKSWTEKTQKNDEHDTQNHDSELGDGLNPKDDENSY